MLTGTLPHLSQQNVFLGVPLLLMPEEVVLLVEKGKVVLFNRQRSYRRLLFCHRLRVSCRRPKCTP